LIAGGFGLEQVVVFNQNERRISLEYAVEKFTYIED
jgi:hypothetical protein